MKKGFIYKIELQDEIYVGSTEQKLCERQSNHNSSLKHYPNQKLYKKCIEQGIEKIKCIWVADIEFNHTAEKRMIEEEYRKKLNAGLNMVRCYTTEEEKKEQQKEYYLNHKEEISKKTKKYRETNKEKIVEKNKKYRENNKEKIHLYRQNNKDRYNAKRREKVECSICKSIVNRNSLLQHQKTKKCITISQSNE